MRPLREDQITGQPLGHLGLVAASIQELGLIQKVDALLPVAADKGAKVTFGQRVAAMILNGLGFTDERLYIFEKFLEGMPVDRLFGTGLEARFFNDDALGRCLDAMAEYGVTKFFTEIAFSIGREKGLLGKTSRGDTSSLTVYGQYPPEREADYQGAQPLHGHSKDNRPDLKQFVLYLATTGATNFPLWMEAHSGNVADKKSLIEAAKRMEAFKNQLQINHEMLHVGDSALYSAAVTEGQGFKWLSRVPESVGQAKNLLASEDVTWQEVENGYRIAPYEKVYKDVPQRWVMVYSQQAYDREIKTLSKQINKEYMEASKELAHLQSTEFGCKKDAHQHMKKLKKLKFHSRSYEVETSKKYLQRGRPHERSAFTEIYKVVVKIERAEAAIKQAADIKGRFILATNELNRDKLSDAEVLWEYKAQSGVERGFQFIKDDTFEVDSIFLKKPSRINALMAVMCLCLMVYGFAEYTLRQTLVSRQESIPNQLDKPTQRPSMKWIYKLFYRVQVVTIQTGKLTQQLVINLNALLKRIIGYFGSYALSIYGLA